MDVRARAGSASAVGGREEQQDAVRVVRESDAFPGAGEWLSVYDGHGGASAADFLKERLHRAAWRHRLTDQCCAYTLPVSGSFQGRKASGRMVSETFV